MYVRTGVLAGKTCRQSRNCLHFLQAAGATHISERSEGRVELIYYIRPTTVRVKCKVTRARAGFKLDPWCAVRGKFAVATIKAINHDLVQTKIGDKGVAIGFVQNNVVSMRPFLPFRIDAGAAVLDHVNGRTQTAVVYGQDCGVPAYVIRHQYKLADLVDSHMTGSTTQRRLLV